MFCHPRSKKIPNFDRNYHFTIFHKIRIFSGFHMWHLMSGRKSTIKDKWIGCNPKSHLEVDKWQEREDDSLDP